MLEFLNLARKVVFDGLRGRIERVSSQGIGPWRSPNAEVDSAWCERLQDPKLFGHFERGIVRQHDTRATHPNSGGGDCNRGHQDLGGSPDNIAGVMMF
jgi:hypothetical protein